MAAAKKLCESARKGRCDVEFDFTKSCIAVATPLTTAALCPSVRPSLKDAQSVAISSCEEEFPSGHCTLHAGQCDYVTEISQENIDSQERALALITKTADKICNIVSSSGEAQSSTVRGNVKAQLSGLASKLADVGISGTGTITSDQYQNVLRKDLAATLHHNVECKRKVFETLQSKLLQ
jgi:Domain of unknown function (DUF4189)